jgi:hypothetical protein
MGRNVAECGFPKWGRFRQRCDSLACCDLPTIVRTLQKRGRDFSRPLESQKYFSLNELLLEGSTLLAVVAKEVSVVDT